jgi:phage baseplate assembly protein W
MKALSFPFRVGTDGAIATTNDYNQIVRGQLIDALMTNFGERVMRPRYGSDAQAALFDPTDELQRQDAAGLIKAAVARLVPRVLVENVTLQIGETIGQGVDPGTIVFDIRYRPTPYADSTNLAVPVASEYVARQIALNRALA